MRERSHRRPTPEETQAVYSALSLPPSPSEAITADPGSMVVCGSFIPAHCEAVALAVVSQAQRVEPILLTFTQYARLMRDKRLSPPPERDDPDIQDDSLRNYTPGSALYRLREAWNYKEACKIYNQSRHGEKTILAFESHRVNNRTPSFLDYSHFLSAFFGKGGQVPSQALEPFFYPWRLPILEVDRERHTIITGKAGYGKSNLIKVLVHGYIKQGGLSTVFVLDPHGDLATEVAQFKEHYRSESLVYIDPLLDSEYSPVINPFDISEKTPETVEVATKELVGIIGAVCESGERPVTFTGQMQTILDVCIATLIYKTDSTFEDLLTFLDDTKNDELIQYGANVLKNPVQKQFLREYFKLETYNVSKSSIRTKLLTLLGSYAFYKLFVGKPTISIRELMDSGKTVVFKLSMGALSEEISSAIGRFITGLMQSEAIQRDRQMREIRKPVHLFLDEFDLFVSPKIEPILKFSRKYRLHLTLAQQSFGQTMNAELRRAVLTNTAVKITGANSLSTLKVMAEETGADLADLQSLKMGEFHIKSGERPSIKIKASSHLVNNTNAMSAEEWRETVDFQLSRYYRRIEPESYWNNKKEAGARESAAKKQKPNFDINPL